MQTGRYEYLLALSGPIGIYQVKRFCQQSMHYKVRCAVPECQLRQFDKGFPPA